MICVVCSVCVPAYPCNNCGFEPTHEINTEAVKQIRKHLEAAEAKRTILRAAKDLNDKELVSTIRGVLCRREHLRICERKSSDLIDAALKAIKGVLGESHESILKIYSEGATDEN